ncbi:hypothetical protein [Streptomyces sp. SA15]|uniref:hypothetical protein n=1 Tax=Streptomyces sp. SA15 TaxID=934019 RepID=UPI0015CC236A|nr:hypothetical protein [Streptomyces sp. SA15]
MAPAEQRVSAGDSVEAAVSWRRLPAGQTYLGLLEYGGDTGAVGTTPLVPTP